MGLVWAVVGNVGWHGLQGDPAHCVCAKVVSTVGVYSVCVCLLYIPTAIPIYILLYIPIAKPNAPEGDHLAAFEAGRCGAAQGWT